MSQVDAAPTFEDFFEAEAETLLQALSVITGSRSEAEDLAQESFTRVLERWDLVSAMESPRGYLYRTAMNLFRSQRRRASNTLSGLGRPSLVPHLSRRRLHYVMARAED